MSTQTDAKALLEAATLEAAQLEGEGTNSPEVVTTTAETVEAAPTEPAKEESKQSEWETAAETNEPENSEEEAKKIERELKKKYLSQVNKKDQEAKEWKAKYEALLQADNSPLKAMEELVDSKFAARETAKQVSAERDTFFSQNKLDPKETREVEAIKSTFPEMKWEAAYNLYLAQNNPEKLIKPSPKTNLSWSIPQSVINPPQTRADLRKAAEKELNALLGY